MATLVYLFSSGAGCLKYSIEGGGLPRKGSGLQADKITASIASLLHQKHLKHDSSEQRPLCLGWVALAACAEYRIRLFTCLPCDSPESGRCPDPKQPRRKTP
jgi:hypothetical protein